jgi:heme-degrading monooxygenase HmoA
MAEQAKFARIWRGRTTHDKAEAYERYWLNNGIDLLIGKGALSVQMLRDDYGEFSEFVTISYWPSVEAMGAEAGTDPRAVHHLPRDPEFLTEVPDRVQIFRILETRKG